MLRRAVHDISGMRREHGRIHVAPTREQVRNDLAESIVYLCALIAHQPRAIDRYIDYFG